MEPRRPRAGNAGHTPPTEEGGSDAENNVLEGGDTGAQIREICREVRELKFRIYGDPQARQEGVYDRLEALEDDLGTLRATYEREKVEKVVVDKIEERLDELGLNYRLALVYLKGIAAGLSTIVVAVLVAGVLGVIRFFGGG